MADDPDLDGMDGEPPGVVVIQIGERGDLTPAHAASSAAALLDAKKTYPAAELSIMLDGYDIDQRELWEIPEARGYIVQFVDQLLAAGAKLADLNLDQSSAALLGVCCNAATITGKDPKTGEWIVEFQAL